MKRQNLKTKKTKPKKPAKKPKQKNNNQNSAFDHFISLLRFNIRFKLTLGYALRIAIILVTISAFVYFGSCYIVYSAYNNIFDSSSKNIEFLFNQGLNYDSSVITNTVKNNNISLYVYTNEYQKLYSFPDDEAQKYNETVFKNTYRWWNGHNFEDIYYTTSKKNIHGDVYKIVLKKSLLSASSLYKIILTPTIIALIIIYLSTVMSASKMATKHLDPIHTMTAKVRQISAKNLSTRLDIRGTKDELKDLAHTFNVMLDGIAHSYEREKQFVSDASHELRTPIAVIKGYASLIQRWGKDDPEVLNESIQAIVSETDSMQSLVESLLFIARKDRGTLKMDFEYFCISDLANEIIRDTNLIDKEHTVLHDIKPNLIQRGSADKLKQAFRILIDNSLKYTPTKGIVQVDLKCSEKHNIFMICDTGIGISQEDLPHIFDRFYRADKSRTKYKEKESTGGTGLGLSIAKIIVEQHGGRILVESEIDVGSKFTIFLPKEAVLKSPTNSKNQDSKK